MFYSKTYQAFSNYLEQPEALTDPEKYLGLNYQDVLNFWIYLDSLSDEEKKEMEDRFLALDDEEGDAAMNAAMNAAYEVVNVEFSNEAWYAAYDVTRWGLVFGYATWELIAHHKLLEQGKTPLALQYCTKS